MAYTKTVSQLAQNALDLMTADGEWPSPEYEDGPQANRARAMQNAIKDLARAVLELAGDIEAEADARTSRQWEDSEKYP